jgi:hypothetical protein
MNDGTYEIFNISYISLKIGSLKVYFIIMNNKNGTTVWVAPFTPLRLGVWGLAPF